MFRFWQAYGTIPGVIGALTIPVRHVSPAKWKKALGLNSGAKRHVFARSRPGRHKPARLPVNAITAAQRRPCWVDTG